MTFDLSGRAGFDESDEFRDERGKVAQQPVWNVHGMYSESTEVIIFSLRNHQQGSTQKMWLGGPKLKDYKMWGAKVLYVVY